MKTLRDVPGTKTKNKTKILDSLAVTDSDLHVKQTNKKSYSIIWIEPAERIKVIFSPGNFPKYVIVYYSEIYFCHFWQNI